MKGFVAEYGMIIVTVLIGIALCVFLQGAFLGRIGENLYIEDAPVAEKTKNSDSYRIPELKGLEKDGKPLAVKIKTDQEFMPINTKNVIAVSAEDRIDGDITDRIKVYQIVSEEGKERKKLFDTSKWDREKENIVTLSYEVKNSAGFRAEKRICLLVSGTGGKT